MFGILLTVLYGIYAQLVYGHTFVQIHNTAMNLLFWWYLGCLIAFMLTLGVIYILAMIRVGVPDWMEAPIMWFLGISSEEPTTMPREIGIRLFRSGLLLGGVYLLQHAFPEGQFAPFVYFGGAILVLIGALWGLRFSLNASFSQVIRFR